MKAQLVIVEGKQKGKTIELAPPSFLIGRGETCHLRPVSELVSREHAEFVIKGDTLFVRDLGSRNGTLVNGKALTTALVLKEGDMVQVGPLVFTVSIHEGKHRGKAAPTGKAGHEAAEAASEAEAGEEEASEGHGGSTIMIPAFKRPAGVPKSAAKGKAKAKPLPPTKSDSTAEAKGASEIMKKMLERRKPKA
jgi:predicted component of type VI protein secretion system